MYKKTLELLNCIPPLDVNKTENVGTKLKMSQRRQTTTAKCLRDGKMFENRANSFCPISLFRKNVDID